MTERIARLKKFFIVEHRHRLLRQPIADAYELAHDFCKQDTDISRRAVLRLRHMIKNENPVIFPEQKIVFARTVVTLPHLFTTEEKDALSQKYRLHETGELSNICVDYTRFLQVGFHGMRQNLTQQHQQFLAKGCLRQAEYINGLQEILDLLIDLVGRYYAATVSAGATAAADSLAQLLQGPPQTLQDALQMQRILHFSMWCSGSYHNTLGRFDQYMLPYFEADLAAGRLTEADALELLEEYFLSFNIDSDLYPGMQQGDNGQSIVLGGVTPAGQDGFNRLSELCLTASLELKLIDPKINLRVGKDTPLEVYRLGTELTKQGLGFPQYSNDDVVIKGLEALGYQQQDARNYAVAACWEFIIPGLGMEIPNIDVLCFPEQTRMAIIEHLATAASYQQLLDEVRASLAKRIEKICADTHSLYIFPSPLLSMMMEGCIEHGEDISQGCVYNNYGIHGAGLATAADMLVAIKRYIYDTSTVTKAEMLDAMEQDFAGYDRLLHELRFNSSKFGNDEDSVDKIAGWLLQTFADLLKDQTNERGGRFRAGTGSAMYYLWASKDMGATPDGRRAGEGFPANYSPSLFMRSKGPLSIIKSFTKADLSEVVNGGPLTIELHDTMFRGEDSVLKVASLIKAFVDMGGHQMQINAVNRDAMLDAQRNPEKHRNMIVRVWGWSGYFVELDKGYQDHIIQRMELTL